MLVTAAASSNLMQAPLTPPGPLREGKAASRRGSLILCFLQRRGHLLLQRRLLLLQALHLLLQSLDVGCTALLLSCLLAPEPMCGGGETACDIYCFRTLISRFELRSCADGRCLFGRGQPQMMIEALLACMHIYGVVLQLTQSLQQ